MALGTIFFDGDHRGVRFERELDATPAEIWRAVATPEGVAGWLARPVRWLLEPGEQWEIAFDDGSAYGLVVAVERRAFGELGLTELYCHAQLPAVGFYASIGWNADGGVFKEAGIDHQRMVLRPEPASDDLVL